MLKDIRFLVIGCLFITFGIIGFSVGNLALAFLSGIVAGVFIARQLFSMYFTKREDPPIKK